MASTFKSRGARPARVSQHGVAANGAWSTRRAARICRGCGLGQCAARSIPTPSVEARPHQHCDRSAAGDASRLGHRVKILWRASRTRIAPWSSGHRTAEHVSRCVDLAWLLWVKARRTPSSLQRRSRLNRTNTATGRRRGGSKVLSQRVRIPWRASRACIAPWSSGRRSVEHAPRSADLTWLGCGTTRGTLHPHAAGRGSTARTQRQVGSMLFRILRQRVRIPWRASHARIAPWSSGRRTAEHVSRSADLAYS